MYSPLYLSTERNRFREYVLYSQFKYCSLVWMCHNHTLHNKKNKLHVSFCRWRNLNFSRASVDMRKIWTPGIKMYKAANNISLEIMKFLRYYATFKVIKFESLFYKINTCLQKPTIWIGLRAEQIFSGNI